MNHHVCVGGRVGELVRVHMGQCKVGKPLQGKLRQMPHDSAGKSQNHGAGESRKRNNVRERQCSLDIMPTILVFRGSGNDKAPFLRHSLRWCLILSDRSFKHAISRTFSDSWNQLCCLLIYHLSAQC